MSKYAVDYYRQQRRTLHDPIQHEWFFLLVSPSGRFHVKSQSKLRRLDVDNGIGTGRLSPESQQRGEFTLCQCLAASLGTATTTHRPPFRTSATLNVSRVRGKFPT
ncbi:hypothetical protein CBL_02529 [Carabus blaptoides fortunei]